MARRRQLRCRDQHDQPSAGGELRLDRVSPGAAWQHVFQDVGHAQPALGQVQAQGPSLVHIVQGAVFEHEVETGRRARRIGQSRYGVAAVELQVLEPTRAGRHQHQCVGQLVEGLQRRLAAGGAGALADQAFDDRELRVVGQGQRGVVQASLEELGRQVFSARKLLFKAAQELATAGVVLLQPGRDHQDLQLSPAPQCQRGVGAKVARHPKRAFDVLVVRGAKHHRHVGQLVSTDAAHLGDAGAAVDQH